MTNPEIAWQRLKNQQLVQPAWNTASEIVRCLGAVQSQDYAGARWAVGQRAGASAAEVEQAVNDGSILRLHVLRPTWHFVTAEDVRWHLALTGPRVIAGLASRHRQLEIDERVIDSSLQAFQQALRGGKHLTRGELETAVNQAGISTGIPQRLNHLLVVAELEGVLCSGRWRGKQPTFALLDERVPAVSGLEKEAALAELSKRYFTSHGPATLKDFSWWSGLTIADARIGVELARDDVEQRAIDGQVFYCGHGDGFAGGGPGQAPREPVAHLLPNYDEFVVAYTDRSAIFDLALSDQLHMRGGVLNNVITINGLVVGGWSREFKKNRVSVPLRLLRPLLPEEQQAVELAARRYGEHLELPPGLQYPNRPG